MELNELSNRIVSYDAEDQSFVLSLSGEIDEHKLDQRVGLLRSSFDSHLEKEVAISEKTHFMTRQVLRKHLLKFQGYRYFFALLTNEHTWQTSDHEAHFTNELKALNWLRSKL